MARSDFGQALELRVPGQLRSSWWRRQWFRIRGIVVLSGGVALEGTGGMVLFTSGRGGDHSDSGRVFIEPYFGPGHHEVDSRTNSDIQQAPARGGDTFLSTGLGNGVEGASGNIKLQTGDSSKAAAVASY